MDGVNADKAIARVRKLTAEEIQELRDFEEDIDYMNGIQDDYKIENLRLMSYECKSSKKTKGLNKSYQK